MKAIIQEELCNSCGWLRNKTVWAGELISEPREGMPKGGLLILDDHWTLNHYGGGEGYLGWLALQPRRHMEYLEQLDVQESMAFGSHIGTICRVLRKYWETVFPDDPLEQVYLNHFMEGLYDRPNPSPYHLHFRLVPRPRSLDPFLRDGTKCCESGINAWRVYEISRHMDFPQRYCHSEPSREELMKFVKASIFGQAPKF